MRMIGAGVLVAALAVAGGIAEAGGPKKPDTPFTVHVFTKSADQEALDSTADVRKALSEKKKDWFRLTDDPAGADIRVEIVGRANGGDTDNVIRGRLSAATLTDAPIVGQYLSSNPSIWKMNVGPWTNAARDMANRLEKYCRETYPELEDARRRGFRVAGAAR